MVLKLLSVVGGFGLLVLMGVPTFAATADDSNNEQQLIEKPSEQTTALQNEVASLQAQVKNLQAGRTSAVKTSNVHKNPITAGEQTTAGQTTVPASSVTGNADVQKRTLPSQPTQPQPIQTLSVKPIYTIGNPVVTSPFFGEHSAFNASDLIVSYPSVGMDLLVLQHHSKVYNMYNQHGLSTPEDPILELSGGLEAQYLNKRPYKGNKQSDIDLTRGEVDITANINNWTTGLMAFAYDNAAPSEGARVANSRAYLDKGFITIGNLKQSPFYGTIGQIYVPFGRYTTYMISDPLTKSLARIRERTIELGFDKIWDVNELNVSTFTFKGDSTTSATASKLNQLGMNADYTLTESTWNAVIGGGLISNIADSIYMQNNGASSGFDGFGGTSEELVRRVPAYDLHGSLGVGSYSLLAEYVKAFHSFSPLNMAYNDQGAVPSALNLEAAYNFSVFNKPSSFAVGYGMTKEALALLLPAQRYIATFDISLWKDTIEGLEFRHDINYPASATAKGQTISVENNGFGHTSDTLTFQIGVYF